MELTQIRNQVAQLLDSIDDEISRQAPPEISAAEFVTQARNICTVFDGPTPDDEKLNQFYRDTSGNLSLMRLLANRVAWKEGKENEPLKSPGGYMASILRNANRRDLLEEAERRFGEAEDATEPAEDEVDDTDDDEAEDDEPAIVKQVVANTQKRLRQKPVTP